VVVVGKEEKINIFPYSLVEMGGGKSISFVGENKWNK
jgi:hypothetical protein